MRSWQQDRELQGVRRYGRRVSLVERKVSASMCPGGGGVECLRKGASIALGM